MFIYVICFPKAKKEHIIFQLQGQYGYYEDLIRNNTSFLKCVQKNKISDSRGRPPKKCWFLELFFYFTF